MSAPVLNDEELRFVREAAIFLENPGFALRAMNMIGKPLEALQKNLPESVQQTLGDWVQKSLRAALATAMKTVDKDQKIPVDWNSALQSSKKVGWMHTAGVALTGAVGGMFGLAAIPIELPLSTTMMLRGISGIASQWGMDLKDPTIQLQCLYVFTLGSPKGKEQEELDSAYLTSRLAFEQMMRSASSYMAKKTAGEVLKALDSGAAPALVKLIARIAKSFELTITEKLLAESVPVLGAIGGATINALFNDYFADAARFHFGLLYLEKKYGAEKVQFEFNRLRS